MIVAAVPVKDLVNAKQRLVPALGPEERRALATAMLDDVLEVLCGARLDAIWVVTRDAAVAALAERRGVRCLTEAANRGHTEAVALAQREAVARGARRFLTIPGDVPCVEAGEIVALCEAVSGAPGVGLVPSLSSYGTNAALLAPPDAMPLKFGEPSFDNHMLTARALGLSPVVLRLPGLGLDIDGPEDLAALVERAPDTRSGGLLRRWGFPARLADRR